MSEFDAQITFLYTQDLEATTDFYQKHLGLEMVLDQGSCRIFRAGSGAYLGFCQRPRRETGQDVILTLVTEDVEGWGRRLEEQGIHLEAEPRHNPFQSQANCKEVQGPEQGQDNLANGQGQ